MLAGGAARQDRQVRQRQALGPLLRRPLSGTNVTEGSYIKCDMQSMTKFCCEDAPGYVPCSTPPGVVVNPSPPSGIDNGGGNPAPVGPCTEISCDVSTPTGTAAAAGAT
jgi:hypothetical protein